MTFVDEYPWQGEPLISKWTVNSAEGMVNAIRLLQTVKPIILEINVPKEKKTPIELKQLCGVIQQKFTGIVVVKLWHSFLNYEDCSHQVKILGRAR